MIWHAWSRKQIRSGKYVLAIVLATTTPAWASSSSADQAPAQLQRHSILGAGAAEASGGVRITVIVPNGSAARAGMRVGDIVSAIGGNSVRSPADFVAHVKGQPAGKPVEFTVLRQGTSSKVPVVLSSAPNENDPAVRTLYAAVSIDGSLRRTLLTLPRGLKSGHPAVFVIGGIGCYSIDSAADHEDAYMRLAHDLGRRGIAAMRLEKSGVGDSQGPPCTTVDLLTEMHSYEVALDALRRDPNVDPRRIYLFGHSIGTLIAPRIAQGRDIAGIIIADGVGRNWIEYELANLRRQLVLDGQTPDKVDARMRTKELCMHRLLIEKHAEADIERDEPACKEVNSYPAPDSYLQQAAALNVAEPWMSLIVPVLAIYGTADFVTAQVDHERIVDIVNAIHSGSATLKLVEGMDHHLDFAGSAQQAYELRVKQHGEAPYQEEFSKTVLDWLCQRERCSSG